MTKQRRLVFDLANPPNCVLEEWNETYCEWLIEKKGTQSEILIHLANEQDIGLYARINKSEPFQLVD